MIKVGTTSLVPVHEYNPIAEESSNEEKTPMEDTSPTPKNENVFHFRQAVAYKMKQKDKLTRTIIKD